MLRFEKKRYIQLRVRESKWHILHQVLRKSDITKLRIRHFPKCKMIPSPSLLSGAEFTLRGKKYSAPLLLLLLLLLGLRRASSRRPPATVRPSSGSSLAFT